MPGQVYGKTFLVADRAVIHYNKAITEESEEEHYAAYHHFPG